MPDRQLPVYRRLYRILVAAGKEFGTDKATRLAAALSFYTLFSLVPLLFLTVAVVGFVSADSALTGTDCDTVGAADIPADPRNPLDRMVRQVDEVAGEQVSTQLANLTCEASGYAGQALGIGIALAAFSASSVFLHVQGVLNYLFHAPEARTSGLVATLIQRGVALVSALLLSILVLAPLVAVAGVSFIQDLIDVSWLRGLLGVAVPLTSLVLMVMVVAATFRLLTRAQVAWQAARRGGFFTALTGLVGAFLVGTYLNVAGTGGALGAVGGAAILLFFFNLMWMIYLFGAEVTKVYADFLVHGDILPPSERSQAPSFEPDEAAAESRD
ncbi:MAG: YihY/virulence factor BrkB family protein, partial [Actinomycetota bacterium]